MRTSTILISVLAAAASVSAAPFRNDFCELHPAACGHPLYAEHPHYAVHAREDGTQVLYMREAQESGAFNWVPVAKIGTKVLPWVTNKLQGYVDKQ